ncbi:octaheme c-type cytochrome, tetrathionate reductase family [Dissulfuribacter thermophilus]|uniref:Octaheme c-type cytochrome, tetrathionate reductase family n=1 Tax=Dissulfuribacter thermophilus TaxID=1156395 RepID=A0A1B9F6F2_9BACT|nr:MG2 domain-containing protein [Dissulfuribacter thermophilus]OCC15414.1 octaheme c-type cytochrome, tetrathionate reductase family [Dissulfuribacter thermophilus]
MKQKFLLLVLLILFGATAGQAAWANVAINFTTDKDSYTKGEVVQVILELTNDQNKALFIDEAKIVLKDPNNKKRAKFKIKEETENVFSFAYKIKEDDPEGTWSVRLKLKAEVGKEDGDEEDEKEEEKKFKSRITFTVNSRTSNQDVVNDNSQPQADTGSGSDVGQTPQEPTSSTGNNTQTNTATNTGGVGVTGSHDFITAWNGTSTCIGCHLDKAEEVHSSVHYQWLGDAVNVVNGPNVQGKLDVGVNSYCINILGNWNGCNKCHIGLGQRPDPNPTQAQLENIDCLICHQKEYKRINVNGTYVPDSSKMNISILEAAQTVHLPERENCLQCHAFGGGGDNFKRGDMPFALSNTSDREFDVHMSTTGANLKCQDCHITQNHKIAGRGSDLRPTELDMPVECGNCHTPQANGTGHDPTINRHIARVACQTCHIPEYARDAKDTPASEKTEAFRNWLEPHQTPSGAIHPTPTMAGNLMPVYKWWNKTSYAYTLFENVIYDPETGKIPTSMPNGSPNESGAKIYPFKYKTALQPFAPAQNKLIALDTSIYFQTGDADLATKAGLKNMGLSENEPYEWVETETFQLITHEVPPKQFALNCTDCHGSTARMDLQGKLGYAPKADSRTLCTQCHGYKDPANISFYALHDKHVASKKYDCSWCHSFSRPERGLKAN